MPPFDVFISYAHDDKSTADAACAALEAEGIRCWMAPRDVAPGQDWAGAIVDAIDHCSVMLLIFSSHTNRSKQVQREVQRAFDSESPVVPLRIENTEPAKALAYYMGPVHWLDALTPPLEAHLRTLVVSVKGLIEARRSARVAAALAPGERDPGATSVVMGADSEGNGATASRHAETVGDLSARDVEPRPSANHRRSWRRGALVAATAAAVVLLAAGVWLLGPWRKAGVAVSSQNADVPAMACKRDAATEFWDDFKKVDEKWTGLGPYQSGSDAFYAGGHLVLKPSPGRSRTVLYSPLNFTSASYCLSLQSPRSIEDAGETSGGLVFWATDLSFYDFMEIYPDGSFSMWRNYNDQSLPVIRKKPVDAVVKGPGAVNQIQVRAAATNGTLLVNGVKVGDFRGQAPFRGVSTVGMTAASEKAQPNEWVFLDVAVSKEIGATRPD
jgi:hypothetical protein